MQHELQKENETSQASLSIIDNVHMMSQYKKEKTEVHMLRGT